MSDQQVRLQAVLDFLEQGKINLAQAVEQVSKMKFEPASQPDSVWDKLAADAAGDMTPPEPDSFFAVSHAFSAGKITAEQYKALAEAAADATVVAHDGQS